MLRKSLFLIAAILLAACGTVPPPAYEVPTLTYEAQQQGTAAAVNTVDALVAMQPTQGDGTTIATVVTAAPTEAPTLVPTATVTTIPATEVPAEPTTAPTTAAGAELFLGTYDTQEGIPWSCNTCHNVDNPTVKIGPSLLGVGTRAYSRVPGMGPYTYIYDSIRKPQDYIVPDFENGQQMPHFLPDALPDQSVYNIIAYLMTLE